MSKEKCHSRRRRNRVIVHFYYIHQMAGYQNSNRFNDYVSLCIEMPMMVIRISLKFQINESEEKSEYIEKIDLKNNISFISVQFPSFAQSIYGRTEYAQKCL